MEAMNFMVGFIPFYMTCLVAMQIKAWSYSACYRLANTLLTERDRLVCKL